MTEPTRAEIAQDVGYLDGHPAKMVTDTTYSHRPQFIEQVRMLLDDPLVSDSDIWAATMELSREQRKMPSAFDVTRKLNG